MLEQIKETQKETRDATKIIDDYDLSKAQIGMIASHSALDLSEGAKQENLPTLAVCQKGREKTYLRFKRIITNVMILERFDQILQNDIQKRLRQANVIFVPNRSLTAYVP